MMRRRWWMLSLIALSVAGGCRHSSKKCCSPYTNGPPGPIIGGSTLPPQSIPIDPPPGGGTSQRPEILMPSAPSSNYRSMPPTTSAYPGTRLGTPNYGTAPQTTYAAPVAPKGFAPAPPATRLGMGDVSPFPVGIADYAVVKPGISTGQRPDLEGLDWLKASGVKTIVFLKSPSDDDGSDRSQAEKRGLRYQSITVTPEALGLEQFSSLVGNPGERPIFVYDRDGSRTGVLWYGYFRTVEVADEETARIRAGRLGWKERPTGDALRLTTAMQRKLGG